MSLEQTAVAAADSNDERRSGHDRRRHSLRTLTYCGLHGRGRRRHRRRAGEDYYLDWYDPTLVYAVMGIMLLSSFDALLTLTLLTRGAYEANLFMAQLLSISDHLFVIIKLAITGLGLLFLLMHAHFRIFGIITGRQAIHALLPVYGLLIAYELLLLVMIQ